MVKRLKLEKGKAILLTDENQRKYFTGFKSSFGYLVMTEARTAFFTDKRYLLAAKERLTPEGVAVAEYRGIDAVKAFLAENDVSEVGIDYSLTTLREYEGLQKLGAKFFDAEDILCAKFAVKDQNEISAIEEACRIAEKAFYKTLGAIFEGMSEKDFADELEHNMHLAGAEKVSFDTIVAFGANSAVPHHETGGAILQKDMPVLVDFGCIYRGYCSDCTRTFYYGKASAEFKKAYDAVLEANETAEREIRENCDAAEAHDTARRVLAKYGMAEAFTHSLGHGIGVNIHEFPYVSPRGKGVPLVNGMVFSVEPGVYFDGKFGVRIEDTVVMDGGRIRRMFGDDKKLIEIK